VPLRENELVLAISMGGDQSSYQSGGMIGYTVSGLVRPIQAFANPIIVRKRILDEMRVTIALSPWLIHFSGQSIGPGI
jgi:hypothetical protein